MLPLFFAALFAASVLGQQRLLIVGGGDRPPAAMRHFVQWAGGEKGRILIVTWASGEPEKAYAGLAASFEAGTKIRAEQAIDPETEADKQKLSEQLKNATGIFFSGGDQNRIMKVLEDKTLLDLIKDRYRAGVPIGGTSAGAAVMSDPMMNGEADLKKVDVSNTPTAKGIGLLPDVIVDQHFLVRQRQNRLFSLMLKYPDKLGIGIDENMAIVVEDGRKLTVEGPTAVMFIDPKKGNREMTVWFLRQGERFDLKKRRMIK